MHKCNIDFAELYGCTVRSSIEFEAARTIKA